MTEVTKIEHPNAVQLDGFPGYAFTTCGKILSFSRKAPFAMKGMPCGNYRQVSLKDSLGEVHRLYMHRVIAEAFHGPCPEGMECRHLDGDSSNNRPSNLAWGTRKSNAKDRVIHGTACAGERHGMAKLTKDDVLKMRNIRRTTGRSYQKIAADFSVSPMTAHRAITGKLWRGL